MAELPDARSEVAFADFKAALTATQAEIEANRCLYCHDAPCIQACPTEIDIPEFIRKIATGNVKGLGGHHLRQQRARHELRAGVPGRGALCVGDCVCTTTWTCRRSRSASSSATRPTRPTTRAGSTSKPARTPARASAIVGAGPASLARPRAPPPGPRGHHLREARRARRSQHHRRGAVQDAGRPASVEEVDWVLSIGGIEVKTGVEDRPGRHSSESSRAKHDALFLGSVSVPTRRLRGVHRAKTSTGVFGAVEFIEQIKLGTVDSDRRERTPSWSAEATPRSTPSASCAAWASRVVTMAYRGGEEAVHERLRPRVESGASTKVFAQRLGTPSPWPHQSKAARARSKALRRALSLGRRQQEAHRRQQSTCSPQTSCWLAIGQEQARLRSSALDGPVDVVDKGVRIHRRRGMERPGDRACTPAATAANGGKEVVNAAAEGKRRRPKPLHAYLERTSLKGFEDMANSRPTPRASSLPNPFWLASAPPTNSGDQIKRAFDARLGRRRLEDAGHAHPERLAAGSAPSTGRGGATASGSTTSS